MKKLLTLLCIVLIGCERKAEPAAAPPPPEVQVSVPVERDVTDYEDFTGRTEAVASVEVRARATGYLDKANFKDGSIVTKGDVLFEIDPRPYESDMRRAEASVAQAKARMVRLESEFERAKGLLPSKVISKEEYDRISSDRSEAEANFALASANKTTASLHLGYTKVKAPISGLISRRLKDPGNLVKQDDTVLTTIVALDPMYATFEVDERTLLRLRRLVKQGAIPAIESEVPFRLGLADEDDFPQEGKINFVDNQVDAGTGTLRLRGVFPNPNQLYSPGLFVRIRLQIGAPHKVVLIADRALGTDQGQKYIYVINDKNEAVYRAVKLGPLHDGLRVIEQGLKPGERIVVTGLQRVRPGTKVDPKTVDMPGAKPKTV